MATDTADKMQGKTSQELFQMGSRAYWTRSYSEAATYLTRSSELLVEEHGGNDKHDSLGNVYLYYGKALLELSREEGNPLGEAVPKEVAFESEEPANDNEEAEDEKKEKNDTKETNGIGECNGTGGESEGEAEAEGAVGGEAMEDEEEGNSTHDLESEDDELDAEEEDKDTKEGEADQETVRPANISINGEDVTSSSAAKESEKMDESTAEDENAPEASAEKEEEPTDLQLAWEVLELAKSIFEARGDAARAELADCLVTLGEVSLENEDFDSAINDISAGLDIQKTVYVKEDDLRKLAETHYKLGMALAAHNKVDEGTKCYETTLEILKKRLQTLEDITSPGASDKDEIKEIKSLIPDLNEKIADLKAYKDEVGDIDKACKDIIHQTVEKEMKRLKICA